jgi:hypothetical protein
MTVESTAHLASDRKRIARRLYRLAANGLVSCALLVTFLVALGATDTHAQALPPPGATPAATPAPAVGVISGLVVGDDGQPLADAKVILSSARAQADFGGGKTINAQTNGRFRFSQVRTGVYYLFADSPGYVLADNPDPLERPVTYRAGANTTLMLYKGGVITGMVTDVTGEPMVGIQVAAVRVRDSLGRKPQGSFGIPDARTDDRGIYRIYGLPAGAYIVAAGAVASSGGAFEFARSALETAPVYYPSSSAESAVKVEVGLGQETGGIDIRVGSDYGHEISGTVLGATRSPDGKANGVVAVLQKPNNGPQVATTFLQEVNGQIQFAFSHVPDGEYELLAETWQRENGAGAVPQRITIKGADVSGVRLTMTAFGSISGRLVLESDATLRERAECAAAGRPAAVEEFSLELRPAKNREPAGLAAWFNRAGIAPDEQGNFTNSGLRAGTYWPAFDFPDDRQYLRSVTRPGAGGKPANALGNGLVLGSGEKITGLTVTLSDGAAGLKGRLALPEGSPASGAAPSGASHPAPPAAALPAHVLVHLVPAEPTAADDVLRYREIEIGADGTFALANIAPGKYWLYAETLPPTAAPAFDSRETVRSPAAWDTAARLKLRRAAEAANTVVELKLCQRVTDYVFRFTPATAR